MSGIGQLMLKAPVIPVLVVSDLSIAQPLAQALVAGGLPMLEVTLRTPVALDVIREMKQVPGAIVGAGTVVNPDQFDAALDAGAEFVVSPGLTEKLARLAVGLNFPYLPGVATAGEIMRGLDLGLTHFKFFPASTSGGIPALKALCAPFGQARFCPTGGIGLETAPDWLALPQVLCVGGSWVAPPGADFTTVEALARQAARFAA